MLIFFQSIKEEGPGNKVERSKSVTERKVDTPSPVPTVRAPCPSVTLSTSIVSSAVTSTTVTSAVPSLQTSVVQTAAPALRRFSYTPSTPLQK